MQTTSGLLSFLFHFLIQTPRAYQAIREEVDRVCGGTPIKIEQLQKLEYIDAALKETMRMKSTAPGISFTPKDKDEVIGGKYLVPKDHHVMIVLNALHMDPKVWGDDAQEFRYVQFNINQVRADSIDPSECLMVDSRTSLLIVGNHSVMEFEDVSVDSLLGKRYSW
jgi:cytochrome P450